MTTHCALARTHQSFGWVTCYSSADVARVHSGVPPCGRRVRTPKTPRGAAPAGRGARRAMVIAAPRAQARTPPAPRRLGRAAGFIFLRG